jgi:hypothetical protein
MSEKLLLAATVTFILMALGVALDSEDSLAAGRRDYFGIVITDFISLYPLLIAFVLWEHRSTRNSRYFSASVGLVATLAIVWSFKIDVFKAVEPVLILLYFFTLVSGFSSALWRFGIWLWRVFRYLTLKLQGLYASVHQGYQIP